MARLAVRVDAGAAAFCAAHAARDQSAAGHRGAELRRRKRGWDGNDAG